MQSPILRLCNYDLKICPSMPGLNASRHQCLNEIGGRRHEGAAREDPAAPRLREGPFKIDTNGFLMNHRLSKSII